MNILRIRELIDLVAEADIAELTISDSDGQIRLARRAVLDDKPVPSAPSPIPSDPPAISATAPNPDAAAAHPVKAPMVGTFHRSAKAGGEPLVEVGARVEVGTPLCVIEAMKIMNEIEADRAGSVTQVLCNEGQAVEMDQPLFFIE